VIEPVTTPEENKIVISYPRPGSPGGEHMRLLEGLSTTRMRRLKWAFADAHETVHAHTHNALAWRPDGEGYEMWAAHTEVIYRQWKAEEFTREAEIAV